MRLLVYVFVVCFLLVGASLAALNSQDVTVNGYWHQITLPLCLVLLMTFVLGVLLGIISTLIGLMPIFRRNK